jgi:photosystem II stability/assembly factor-like uncharacterized protein
MTDPFDRLRQPVEPLPPPAGTFDLLLARAHRRRAARATLVGTVIAAVLFAAGGFLLNADRPTQVGQLVTPVTSSPPTAAPSVAPSSPHASTAPSAAEPGTTAPQAAGGPVPRGFRPYSVTSVGGGVTFLLGDAPCQTAPCTSIVRSSDGGRTWIGLPAPRAPLPDWSLGEASPRSGVRDLRFASARDGWAYGGALFATHDGARSWTKTDPGGTVLDLATDGTTAYAVVATCDASGASCSNARLRSTAASRDRWRDVPGVGGAAYGRISLGGGGGVVVLTQSSGTALLFVRSGSRWNPVTSPCPTSDQLAAATAAAASSRLFGFCGGGALGSLYLGTYVSTDGGHSWRRQSATPLSLANGSLVATAAATSQLVFAGTLRPDIPGALVETRDGGRNWTDATVPAIQGGWRYVGASSASSLVALPGEPDGSVWTSRDGGLRWAAYRFR